MYSLKYIATLGEVEKCFDNQPYYPILEVGKDRIISGVCQVYSAARMWQICWSSVLEKTFCRPVI
jgi:hypothetical protein